MCLVSRCVVVALFVSDLSHVSDFADLSDFWDFAEFSFVRDFGFPELSDSFSTSSLRDCWHSDDHHQDDFPMIVYDFLIILHDCPMM